MYASSRAEPARHSLGHVLLVAALVAVLVAVVAVTVVMVTPESRVEPGDGCAEVACATTVP